MLTGSAINVNREDTAASSQEKSTVAPTERTRSISQATKQTNVKGEAGSTTGSVNSLLALAAAIATALPSSKCSMSDIPWPYYLIGTRDSFIYNLVSLTEVGFPW